MKSLKYLPLVLLLPLSVHAQSFSATPLMDMGRNSFYKGFSGGLYENSSDLMPADHDAAGRVFASQVQPLDTSGNPSSSGKVAFVSIGMSNASDEFVAFMKQAAANSSVNHSTLKILNGAMAGIVACDWTVATGAASVCGTGVANQYDRVRDKVLAPAGLTERQVQVVWIKEADRKPAGTGFSALCAVNAQGCTNSVKTTEALRYEQELGEILRAAKSRWPNLRLAFVSTRIYGGYAVTLTNPEPFAYEYGFSAKWGIQAQINQMRGQGIDAVAGDLNYNNGKSAWAAWGPYLWADGTTPRSDGLVWCNGQPGSPCIGEKDFQSDGTHPTAAGSAKVANLLMNFFLTSPYSQWFGGSSTAPPPPVISVTMSPTSATLQTGQQQQLTATVSGTSNTAVTWTVNNVAGGNTTVGTITTGGLYTAPASVPSSAVTVTATSVADSTKSASAAVTVTATPVISVTLSPTSTTVQTGQQQQFTATVSGTNNTALTLKVNGVAGGNTTVGTVTTGGLYTAPASVPSGSVTVTAVSVADATKSASAAVTVTTAPVAPPPTSGFDGPAELPRVYVNTTVPTQTGTVTTLAAGGDLQSAINGAKCGDTIQLQAGAVFTGSFTLPAQTCDDTHWIMIRSAASDAAFPAQGTRITPCYSGVASLPGRPSFNCASTTVVTAQIQSTNGLAPFSLASGASHYWLGPGLEITRGANGVPYGGGLIQAEKGATFDHLVIDRSWVHGTAQDETARGLQTAGGTNVAVVDSFFTDFHCVSITGTCTDSQAVSGGTGDNPSGPIKIVDNFLEAGAEGVLFGGGEANQPPTDIEVRLNHFFKPMIWMKGQPGFVGGTNGNPFIVKNHFELKNGQRVLYEANIAENTWGGFSQTGYSLLITPKNQAGANGTNLCPACLVDDVTVRYSTFSHMAGGMQTGNGKSSNGGVPADGQRWSIHDVTVDDVDPVKYTGGGFLFEVGQCDGCPSLQHYHIDHITGFDSYGYITLMATGNPKISDFDITNSIIAAGNNQLASSSGKGATSCVITGLAPLTNFDACFTNYLVTANAWIGGTKSYPAGNWFPADGASVGFTNYNNGNGGDYTLLSTSAYKNAGTDGKDLGADIGTINQMTAAVR